MSKTRDIAGMLIECGCDAESIESLVGDLCKATRGKEILAGGIAVAIYLKFLARKLDQDNDTETNVRILLNLADAYDVEFKQHD